jgi:DNA repair exonuclease SbcCD ATPase subunit
MNLNIDGVEIERFKSIIKKQKLDLKARGVGLHFVHGRNNDEPRLGSNGAGKSSIWDAICWCLFGRTPDGLRNPDIKPWWGRGGTNVTVRLAIGRTRYDVTRQTEPNRLFLDDDLVDQDKINRLIGLNVEIFTHTILLGQGQPLFFDLTPRDKMELFSAVLDLDRWEQRSEKASSTTTSLERECAESKGELTRIESELATTEASIETLRSRADSWQTERDEQARALKERIKHNDDFIRKEQPKVDKADLALDGALAEVRPLQKQITELHASGREIERNHAQFEAEVHFAQQQVDELRSDLALLADARTCPTCQQPITPRNIRSHRDELEDKLAHYQGIVRAGVPKKTVSLRKDYRDKVERLTKALEEFQRKADEAQQTINVIGPQVIRAKAQNAEHKQQVDGLESESNPFREQFNAMRKRRSSLLIQKKEKEETIAEQLRRIERTKFWTKGFKDVRLYMIEEVLQELQLVTNAALADVGLMDWQVKYGIEKETKSGTVQRGLNVTILSPNNRVPVRWESWSGGEMQRLRIIGALALSDVLLGHAGINCGLEIIDEPSQHLSGDGVRDLCDYLAERAQGLGKQTFLVDHVAIQSSRFSSVINVTKERTGTILT